MKKNAKPFAIILAMLVGMILTGPSCCPAAEEMLYLTVDKLPTGKTNSVGGEDVIQRTVNAVRQELDNPGKMDFVPWARGISMMSQDRPMAMFPLLRTKEREDRYQWAGPLARLKWGLFQLAKATDKIHSLSEARKMGAVIGAFRQDPRGAFFKKLGFAVEETNSAELNADKLIHGRVDLIVFSKAAVGLLKRNPKFAGYEFRAAVEFEPEDFYIAFSKATDPDYVREWNATFKRLLGNGAIRRIWENSDEQGLIPPFK